MAWTDGSEKHIDKYQAAGASHKSIFRRALTQQTGLHPPQPESETVMTEQDIPHTRPKYNVTVTESPKFDLQQYIANYKGRTAVLRLYLIASCSTVLAEEASRLAVAAAKNGKDISLYQDTVQRLSQVTGKPIKDVTDENWITLQEKKNDAETRRLENELKQYKNNLIRESIRMGSEELGVHYHGIGDLGNALKSFHRMKDYTTAQGHVATMSFLIIAVNAEQKNWLGIGSQLARVRSLHFKPEESAKYQPKIHAAMGLHLMCQGEFKEAANAFLNTDFSLGDSYTELISPNDIAVYGGLCALASMSRTELQTKVLENANFRSFLELEPHIRRAINSFCASKYGQCLEIIESYRADYLLDIHLQDQVPNIYKKIRTKAIVQYFQPFSRVTLDSMEEMFGSAAVRGGQTIDLKDEIITMIQSDALNARIDMENNVLIAHEEDARGLMQQKVVDTVDKLIKDAQVKLLRMNAVNGGLVVKPDPKPQGKGALDIAGLVDSSDQGAFRGNGYSLRNR